MNTQNHVSGRKNSVVRKPVLTIEVRFSPWDWNWSPWYQGVGGVRAFSWLFFYAEAGIARQFDK